ncbi:CUB_2 domain-containing protein [Caenorhabditis elegans]|nr:CUB_2 domain-containing protein [Caenorhabditis elegans]CBW44377.1 CUB_2 domain-containing protein [Caenorhabditis elegans]|eukprot:NP_001256542.1 Uncharacterized protein CELE_F35E12.9 [Caenorhabditis elegans]
MYIIHTGNITNVELYVSPTIARVNVVGVSGKSSFMLTYLYKSLEAYKQTIKKTGEYFPLSLVTGISYYTITSDNPNEKVVLSYAMRVGVNEDKLLAYYYVYDGDNINNATMIGNLDTIGGKITVSSGRSVTIVNFYGGTKSNSYALGNDASTVQGYDKYTVLMTSKGTTASGNMTSLATNGGLYTFICVDCSTFYYTQLRFDSMTPVSNRAYVTFQGMTPTHKKEKLIKYDMMTVTDKYFPQMMPSNIITLNVYLARVGFMFNNVNDDTQWKKAYDGRKGMIFSPNLWMSTPNSFSYEIRDDSQMYNFAVTINKMSFPASSDKMTLIIGPTTGNPTLNNMYPRDQSSTGKVS